MLNWFKSGAPWIWLTGGAVSVSLIAVLGLLLVIGWRGLTYFWPAPLLQWQTPDGKTVVGQLYARESVPVSHLKEMNLPLPEKVQAAGLATRLNIKVANRDLYGSDFIALLEFETEFKGAPQGWAVIERSRGGQLFGKPLRFDSTTGELDLPLERHLRQALLEAEAIRDQVDTMVEQQVRVISSQLEKLRLEKRRKQLNNQLSDEFLQHYVLSKSRLEKELALVQTELDALRAPLEKQFLYLVDMQGETVSVPLSEILDFWYPNDMNFAQKLAEWGKQAWRFLSESPRESNSEGGVFPAIFGTVFLVIIMSIIVMPLGVIAAIYLHEYAQEGAFTRIIRVAVINLAGVPSIVYGVFGLGFFVYTIGASVDNLFYAERLPTPTFGTPGLLWSALTLAVLTLPVVIVATEEGLSRIPISVRHGSLALGATQFETIWRIVLPMASPAIITGLILAIARAAGEVAPLMLVGAVKLASSLPVDGEFPFIYLERKFMHLGFHIYDIGFQTNNIEAARPLVYATSFLLVTVIVALNLTAISIRNNLREKYRTLGQD
ncbi:phosphate ABC transporter permease PstA [Vibrio cholerae]|uniref:phosphate ABC transporter permease PstA n=1 Tax=Vibrio cholerae TaxID=666 RepID=UPI001669544B|nr:phosphate ABC transporter permease PstA [Vibrio cholerae]GFK34174.1 Phosphate transport system permease protein PstA [Vibrio cholerae]GFK37622.1 Phosphate transport system permease protein PstA [Vibrio cholerae]GFK41082.1 Phosphate transport system permease protein PstA [Vibrio cholerae]GFK44773.1 Phosphate transport system permease protein PstA [Vibrio cholerae]GFK47762.1 Phosphate transport system permease protein PstA [Vibrio cholerae]